MEPPPSLNASMYRAPASGTLSDDVSISSAVVTTNKGVYSNPPGGVMSDAGGTRVDAGDYMLVASTFKPTQGAFELTVWSTVRVSVTPK